MRLLPAMRSPAFQLLSFNTVGQSSTREFTFLPNKDHRDSFIISFLFYIIRRTEIYERQGNFAS